MVSLSLLLAQEKLAEIRREAQRQHLLKLAKTPHPEPQVPAGLRLLIELKRNKQEALSDLSKLLSKLHTHPHWQAFCKINLEASHYLHAAQQVHASELHNVSSHDRELKRSIQVICNQRIVLARLWCELNALQPQDLDTPNQDHLSMY
ncbi:MAG: hypothetical protein AAF267_17170 [Deinococcota bacterium]